VVSQPQHGGEVPFQYHLAVEAQGDRDHLGPDERVAVLVPADPRTELQDPSQARCAPRKLALELILKLPVRLEGRRDQGVLEKVQGALYLLLDLGASRPELVGLPQDGDLLGQLLFQSPPLLPG
jgi:hypothetical protein